MLTINATDIGNNLFRALTQSSIKVGHIYVMYGAPNISDGSVVSFQKTAVAVVLASVVVFLKTAVAVVMQLCLN